MNPLFGTFTNNAQLNLALFPNTLTEEQLYLPTSLSHIPIV